MKFLSEMIHKKRSLEEGMADEAPTAGADAGTAQDFAPQTHRPAAAPAEPDTVAAFDDDDDDFDWDLDSIDLDGDDDLDRAIAAPRPARTAATARENKPTTDTVNRVTALIDALDTDEEEEDNDDDLFGGMSAASRDERRPASEARDDAPKVAPKPRRPQPRGRDANGPKLPLPSPDAHPDGAPVAMPQAPEQLRSRPEGPLDDIDEHTIASRTRPQSRPVSTPVSAPVSAPAPELYPEMSASRSRPASTPAPDLYPEMTAPRSRPATQPVEAELDLEDDEDFDDLMGGPLPDGDEDEDTAPLRLDSGMTAAPVDPIDAEVEGAITRPVSRPVSRPTSQPAKAKIWDIDSDEDDAPLLAEPARQSAAPVAPVSPVETPAPAPAAAPEPASAPRAGRVKTRLLGFGGLDDAPTDPISAAAQAPKAASQFPVGWIVVTEGPGRGASFTLSGGASTIGRGENQAVRLDFGDTSISREGHAVIAFDDEQNKFYIGHGGKANLVRLNGMPVLSTEPLKNADLVRIGETTLRFVALCGDEFSWNHAKGGQHAAE